MWWKIISTSSYLPLASNETATVSATAPPQNGKHCHLKELGFIEWQLVDESFLNRLLSVMLLKCCEQVIARGCTCRFDEVE